MPKARFRAMDLVSLGIGAGCLVVAPALHAQDIIQTPRGPGFLIYGNYCGPGNRGPRYKPIDALDLACAHHDACWPSDPAVLPACACNTRLHVEASHVARDPQAPAKTREMAQFISDFATAIPCEDRGDTPRLGKFRTGDGGEDSPGDRLSRRSTRDSRRLSGEPPNPLD